MNSHGRDKTRFFGFAKSAKFILLVYFKIKIGDMPLRKDFKEAKKHSNHAGSRR
jgi:hypothetical protein